MAARRIINNVVALVVAACFLAGTHASTAADAFAGGPASAALHRGHAIAVAAATPVRLFASTHQRRSATRYALATAAIAQPAISRAALGVRSLQLATPSAAASPHGSRAPPIPSLS